MVKEKILFIDTETGGIDPLEHSLLSIGLAVWENYEIKDQIEVLIDDGILNVTNQALEINGIDIEQHKKDALSSEKAFLSIFDFVTKNFSTDQKIVLGGHNINFDVNFFKFFLKKNNHNFNNLFSHRYVDTATILYYLYLGGIIKNKTLSSQQAFDFFNIKIDSRHTAIGDVVGTAKLFSILLKLITKKQKISSNDIHNQQFSLFE